MCLFIVPTVIIRITILRVPSVESGQRPIMQFSNFAAVHLFWYMYESVNANFDDMGCTWNAGHGICMISSMSRDKPWT